jgi:hypothetical protein
LGCGPRERERRVLSLFFQQKLFFFILFQVMDDEQGYCNLEVDVNGEETFMVDKVIQI